MHVLARTWALQSMAGEGMEGVQFPLTAALDLPKIRGEKVISSVKTHVMVTYLR